VLRRTNADPPVFDAKLHERLLKTRELYDFLPEQGVGELVTVISLHLMDFERSGLDCVTQEQA
jgi:hypothetical protein